MWWLYPGSVLLVVGGVLVYLAWIQATAASARDAPVVHKPIERFGKLSAADVEALRARAEARRSIAAARYVAAGKARTGEGESVRPTLRILRKP